MKEKCIICESGHSGWVNEQHKAGLSTREIAKSLETEFGLSVSHVTVASHLNHGDKSDSEMTGLEARIRNLEVWMLNAIPDTNLGAWHEHNAGSDTTYTLSSGTVYRSTIPNPEGLESEKAALTAALVNEHKANAEAQREAQRKEAIKRNETIAAEKREREEMAKRAKELEEKERIDKLREQVDAYDSAHNE